MNRETLIARTMMREFPFTIAKKDKVRGPGVNPFANWTSRDKPLPSDVERQADERLAEKAAEFLRRWPYAYVVGCQMDRGKLAWIAWRSPYLIAKALGRRSLFPRDLAGTSQGQLVSILKANRLGCFSLGHERAARQLRDGAVEINRQWKGRAELLWESASSVEELCDNWDRISGVGVGIRNMAIKFNFAFGMVPQISKSADAKRKLQLKPDTHVIHVFYRSGLTKDATEAGTMEAAARLSPDFPLALDSAGFLIGAWYCHRGRPSECDACPLAFKSSGARLCPRRV